MYISSPVADSPVVFAIGPRCIAVFQWMPFAVLSLSANVCRYQQNWCITMRCSCSIPANKFFKNNGTSVLIYRCGCCCRHYYYDGALIKFNGCENAYVVIACNGFESWEGVGRFTLHNAKLYVRFGYECGTCCLLQVPWNARKVAKIIITRRRKKAYYALKSGRKFI